MTLDDAVGEACPGAPACGEEVCITCSDEAVEARVVELRPGGLAVVEVASARAGMEQELVSVTLVDAVAGSRVLVHAKEAIALLDQPQER